MMSRRHLLVLVPAIAVACGGEAQVPEATPATSAPTTSMATTTTVPPTTTTLGPEEVVDAFHDQMIAPGLMAEAELVMEITLGDLTVEATGSSLFHDGNYYSVIDIAGQERHETIFVGGITYEREEDGPWISDERRASPFSSQAPGESPPPDPIALLKTIETLEHQSTVVEAGVTLHRIGLPPGTPVDPVAFGYASDYPVEIDMVFWAKEDGSPHRSHYVITDAGDPDGVITTKLEMTFVEPGGPIEISPPDDPWLRHHSDDLAYSIAHPRGWDVEAVREEASAPVDVYLGLDGDELDVYRTDLPTGEEVSLNALVDEFRSLVTSNGLDTAGTEEIEVADFPGRMLSYGGDDGAGGQVAGIYVVTQVSPTAIFEFILFGDTADSVANGLLMLDFLSTFEVDG